jgi:hypothetical protein
LYCVRKVSDILGIWKYSFNVSVKPPRLLGLVLTSATHSRIKRGIDTDKGIVPLSGHTEKRAIEE